MIVLLKDSTGCHYALNTELSPSRVGLGPAVVCCVISQLCTLFSYHWHSDASHCFPLPLIPFNAKKIVKPDHESHGLNTKVCSAYVMKACAYIQTQNNSIIKKKSKLKCPLSFSELLNASHSLLENISLQ